MLGVGWYGARNVHKLMALPDMAQVRSAMQPFFQIGIPAVLTQLATPVGNAYVTGALARFGDDAVAGMAVIGRLVPVAFVALFALSGAVGPILAQNLGAKKWDRLQSTLRDSFLFSAVYVLVVWALLALFSHQVADLFGADALARELIVFFCLFVAGSYVFNGFVFVASAVFNNLGHPTYSTVLNWARSTLGVIPFVAAGAAWYGAKGALAGSAVGVIVFGVIALVLCVRVVNRIVAAGKAGDALTEAEADDATSLEPPPSANSPFSSGSAATVS